MKELIKGLVINPGSTSTKYGVYENETCVYEEVIRHEKKDLEACGSIIDQKDLRKQLILDTLQAADQDLESLDMVVGRGGIVKPLLSGTYTVNDEMLNDLLTGDAGQHASALGGIIAREIADELGVPSFVVDPVVVDEYIPEARVSGFAGCKRYPIFHALNQKAVARRFAQEQGKDYEDVNVIVAHLGGGISVGAHEKGKIIDVNNALNGEGPLSPERSGSLLVFDVIELCFSEKYTKEELTKLVSSGSGLTMLVGSNDFREVMARYNTGEEEVVLAVKAMAYQIVKWIGAMFAALKGEADGIVLTGGLVYDPTFVELISQRVEKLAEVTVYPGEDELLALIQGGLRVIRGETEAMVY